MGSMRSLGGCSALSSYASSKPRVHQPIVPCLTGTLCYCLHLTHPHSKRLLVSHVPFNPRSFTLKSSVLRQFQLPNGREHSPEQLMRRRCWKRLTIANYRNFDIYLATGLRRELKYASYWLAWGLSLGRKDIRTLKLRETVHYNDKARTESKCS